MRYYLFAVVVLILLGVLARFSLYTVGPTEYVYVTQFGRHIATYDGANTDTDAGLHWGWPWPITSVQRIDRRLQFVDLPSNEIITHDRAGKQGHRLIVEAYVCWRIAGNEDVDRFVRRLGAIEDAKSDIGQKINSFLGGELQKRSTEDLLNTSAAVVENTMQEIHSELMEELKPRFRQEYGVDLVDVRLRRFAYHPRVRSDIFNRIRSEREKKAGVFRSQGEKIAADIASEADKEKRRILAEAKQKEATIRGAADVEAARIRNEAQSKDPEFYVFLKKLKSLKSILSGNGTVLLLSSHRQIFEMLFRPPQSPQPKADGNAPPKQ